MSVPLGDLTFTIAPGGIADLSDVMVAMGDAFDPEYGEAWTEAQCAGILGLPGSWLLIARTGAAEPAGFALCRSVADEAELLLIAVRKRFRRHGIARTLLREAMSQALDQDIRSFHLEVRQGNPAIALYQGSGFEQVGTRSDYYRGRSGKVFDALTFKRLLRVN
ncbi:MAG: GNAT family N-acetyltransferase [Proteobacteria bacterium]|nr:GNAT family N-acetyltransferase [Pseudomonadota bacterium]